MLWEIKDETYKNNVCKYNVFCNGDCYSLFWGLSLKVKAVRLQASDGKYRYEFISEKEHTAKISKSFTSGNI